jgi:ribosomal protein S18 acetylase RimI-like enzyme
MELSIEELDLDNLEDAGKVDGLFVIESQLVLQAMNNQISFTVIDLRPRQKRYTQEERDYSTFVDNPEKVIFLAYVEGIIAGQIILYKYWNNYAYVEDIAVAAEFRRHGVGRALIDQAKQWARQKQFPGIMLETQNNNVQACRFYESCGFQIGGFDNMLYRGLDSSTDEVAIYYYFHFED